jgi:hypothetical protein
MGVEMIGYLQIEGELDVLAEIAAELQKRYPDGLSTVVEPYDEGGWNVEAARALIERLAPRQRMLLRLLATSGETVDDDTLREELGNNEGSLKGITGPITKHINNLIDDGVLDDEPTQPWVTQYDPEIPSFQRTIGMRMPTELVEIFRAAFAK